MNSKHKAVVTGGAGFIGSHIADALLARGYEVHVIDNLSGGKRENVPAAALFHEIDILDTKAITPIVSGAAAVFHEAALPRVQFSVDHPFESHQANVDGTLSVLIAARDGKVGRVVYAASASAYGNQETMPLRENMLPTPVNPYGLHKYMGELYMKMFADVYGIPTLSLRYFNVYGPRMDPEGPYGLAVARFLDQFAKGENLTIVGDGTQTRDFTHVRDIVNANMRAMESGKVGKGEVINIGAGKNISVNYLADLIDPGGKRLPMPIRVEAHDSRADNTLAKELLAWRPTVTIEEGIAELKGSLTMQR
ncbi:NAD-dependent epimerase/dehydratase family protein [Candidatus Kaiserbacteria bacterium]|nr:NAD-dependent epimerase/dehydratase family protein [Candidatus Kaiserbacteria bacterium]